MRLLLATRNDHKLREFGRLLDGVELDPLPAEVVAPDETGETYAANALIKARAAAAATGRPAIADDSGIEAEPLGWGPGVRTARYAGPEATDAENLERFVAEVPPGAPLRYVCVIAHVTAGGAEHLFEGTCAGTMAAAPAGTGGFGYDPVFVPDEESGAAQDDEGGAAPDGADPNEEGRAAPDEEAGAPDGADPNEEGRAAPDEEAGAPDAVAPRTMAELTDAEKDAISHRGRAARALRAWLDG